MKIAVTSTGPTLDDHIATEFDHSKYLLIVDCDTMEFEAMISPVVAGVGPAAGRLFARQLLEANASKVLASHIRVRRVESFSGAAASHRHSYSGWHERLSPQRSQAVQRDVHGRNCRYSLRGHIGLTMRYGKL